MIHRTVLGSMERFLACLTEHYGGAFPVWLAPVQVTIIPIADRHIDYARQIEKVLQDENFRTQLDDSSERMNLKIREAQFQKVPYMIIIGDKEMNSDTISLRLRNGKSSSSQSLSQVITTIQAAVKTKS